MLALHMHVETSLRCHDETEAHGKPKLPFRLSQHQGRALAQVTVITLHSFIHLHGGSAGANICSTSHTTLHTQQLLAKTVVQVCQTSVNQHSLVITMAQALYMSCRSMPTAFSVKSKPPGRQGAARVGCGMPQGPRGGPH